jgi:flagellar hook-length control protein FliK
MMAPPAKPVAPAAAITEPAPAAKAAVPEQDQIEGDDGPARSSASPAGDARPATPAAAATNATPATTDAPRALGDLQTGTGWRLASDAVPLHAARAEAVQQAAVSPQHVAGQITLAIAAASEGSVEIRLDPPELGRVQIRLDPTDNGVRAVVMAERPETQDLLRRHSETLARDLTEAGYSSVSLDFSAGGQSAQQRDERLAQFAATAPVPLAARGDISIEPPRQSVAGRLDIRL